ncbi:BTB/POZ and MATH domain-containing protein 1-like [Panicum miliaceum]|uniref:BTB/POZ and MATH domain-containing protein 1-like n=1 Tax=Panicum miliaceum TaxID=4540 RepID=A0A3L6RI51_PANMI|nr:BTB/POZ and MATH domain-containing protein 1-like [Panicum miliaceum]
MGGDGAPSSSHAYRCVQMYPPEGFEAWGFAKFVKRADLESGDYLKDGRVTIMFGVIVLRDDSATDVRSPIAVPSSDIGDHLSRLLNGADGSDISFSVGGETFRAHRAVLAALLPVFKVQLLGSMVDATMPTITLHGVQPETFRNLLRFIYTDVLPANREVVTASSTTTAFFQDLLAAADMYALDRLKLACAQRLWEGVSADIVAVILGCAEMHDAQLPGAEEEVPRLLRGGGELQERGADRGVPAADDAELSVINRRNKSKGGSGFWDSVQSDDWVGGTLDKLRLPDECSSNRGLSDRWINRQCEQDQRINRLEEELKKRCIDFFVVEKNFRSAVLTEGYLRLMQSFPSVINEIRARVVQT